MRQALGPAVRDVLAGDRGRQVDGDEVAGLRGPLDALERSEPRPQGLQFGVDLLVGNLDGFDRNRDGAQVGQVDVGPDVDLGGEDQFFAVLDLRDLDLRLAERPQVLSGDRLAIAGGQHLIDHLLEHCRATDPGFKQFGRCLTGSEPGQPHLLGELLVGAVEIRLQFGEGHLHVDANPGGAQFLDGALHAGTPVLLTYAAVGVSG